MTWQKATARRIGSGSPAEVVGEALFGEAFQQPMMRAASSTLSWLLSSLSRSWMRAETWASSMVRTMTL